MCTGPLEVGQAPLGDVEHEIHVDEGLRGSLEHAVEQHEVEQLLRPLHCVAQPQELATGNQQDSEHGPLAQAGLPGVRFLSYQPVHHEATFQLCTRGVARVYGRGLFARCV